MRIVIFDTETTNLEKPFVYNIGYVIYDTETQEILTAHDFVVEQVWHNKELFSTAYYANKRELYVKRMRARETVMEKLGYITQFMCNEFKAFAVESAYAYNSPFDDKVFNFNCEWFKVKNPFDNIPIFDIRGYVFKKIAFTDEYKNFCEKYELFTESGNYSTSAESVYKYLSGYAEFEEEHTALADSGIELEILLYCIYKGCEYEQHYKIYRSVRREVQKHLEVRDIENHSFIFPYKKITTYKEKDNLTKIYLKD